MAKKSPVARYPLSPESLRYSNHAVTLSEAVILTGMSRTAVLNALHTGKVKGRGSFTGGDWLIDYHSLIRHYPLKEDVWQSVQSGSQLVLPGIMGE